MSLSEIQRKIVEAEEEKIIVLSAAASGKTAVLTERVRHLLNSGVDPKEIVVITFTNAAAEELNERLNKPTGLFVGTIHSYANYLLRASGHDTTKILDEEKFNKLFYEIKKNISCVKHVSHLLLDEAQDSTPEQFEFLLDLVDPDNYMLVGDVRQSIYRWAGAFPDYILELMNNPYVTVYELNENYRNGNEILRFAKNIIALAGSSYRDYSVAMCEQPGKVIEVPFSADGIARSIASYKGKFGDWFVLTRTNDEISTMCRSLERFGVPYDTFKKASLTSNELNEKMKANTVKVLTIHTSKGLEAKNVAVVGARFSNLEEKCISYVAATRAKELLVWTHKVRSKKPKMENWE